MDAKERILELCQQKGITAAKLERDLDFANAYIRQMNPETVQYNRLKKIADYLGTTAEYLMTGEESFLIGPDNEVYYIDLETAKAAKDIFDNKELRLLFDAARDASSEDLSAVRDMLLLLKKKEEK